jgi:hypothetical protein
LSQSAPFVLQRRIARPLLLLAPALAAALALGERVSYALGEDGSAFDTSDYTIDFYTGPILDSSRNTGLAGSFSALSAGVNGYGVNPASVALRVPWSASWFDWELDGSISLPATLRDTDFDNNGDTTVGNDAALFITGGGGIQIGELGLGLQFGVNDYETVSTTADGQTLGLGVSFVTVNLVAGCVLENGQLALGVGLGGQSVQLSRIDENDNEQDLASVSGTTLQIGAIWAPTRYSLRAGVALRVSPQDDSAAPDGAEPDAAGVYRVDNFVLPSGIKVPTELQIAFATQLFRSLNFGWHNPRRSTREPIDPAAARAYRSLPRKRVLLSSALKVTFPATNAVGTDSFLKQEVERSGRKISVSPRLGVETEPIIDWLVVRAGSYYEPTRFAHSSARIHGTAGADLHIPITWSAFGLFDDDTTFRIGGAVDGAARYFGWSVSAGIWR